MIDRFDGREEAPEWHEEAFLEGVKARQLGFDLASQNPYEHGMWLYKSFRAGWVDQDMIEAKEES